MLLNYNEICEKVSMQKVFEFYNLHPARKIKSIWYYLCPFHRERTASLALWKASNSCSCLGCGKGFTNAIFFVKTMEDLSYHDAALLLIRMFNLNLSNMKEEFHAANETYSMRFNLWRLATLVDSQTKNSGEVRILKAEDVDKLIERLKYNNISNRRLKHLNLDRIIGKYITRIGQETQITDFIAHDETTGKSYSVYHKPYSEASREIAEKYLKGAVSCIRWKRA